MKQSTGMNENSYINLLPSTLFKSKLHSGFFMKDPIGHFSAYSRCSSKMDFLLHILVSMLVLWTSASAYPQIGGAGSNEGSNVRKCFAKLLTAIQSQMPKTASFTLSLCI